MPAAVDRTLVALLHAEGGERGDAGADASDRRALPEVSILRRPADGSASAPRGGADRAPPGGSPDAPDGPSGGLSGAADQRPASRAPGVALSAQGLADRAGEPCLVRRHHLHPGAARLPLPGGDHGLGEPPRPGLAAVEHAGRGLLYRRAGGGPGGLRHARDLQHRPGQPVHQLRLHRALAEGRHPHLDGRTRPVHGQHLHRAAVALAQVRGGLSARDRRRLHRPARDRRVDRLLQHPEAALGARRADAGRGIPRRHACGYVDKALRALSTYPQAQQQQQEDRFKRTLAA